MLAYFTRESLFDPAPRIPVNGDFDLIGVVKKITIQTQSKMSKNGNYQYPSSNDERVKLDIELIDHTVVSIPLPQDFPMRREYQVHDFVRLRSVYLPNPTLGNKLAPEQEMERARSLEKRFYDLLPTRFFNVLRIPAYF